MASLKELLRNIKGLFFHNYKDASQTYATFKDDKENLGWHIYATGENDETRAEYARRFRDVHLRFKRKILLPAVHVLDYYADKHYKGLPDLPHNEVLRLYEESWQESVTLLHTQFLRHAYKGNPSEEHWVKQSHKSTGKLMRSINKTHMLLANTDTVQREFINVFTYTLVKKFFDKYGAEPSMQHLFYTAKSINHPVYFHLHVCPQVQIVSMKDAGNLTCCELEATKGTGRAVYKQTVLEEIDNLITQRKASKKDVKHLLDLKKKFT